MIGCIVGIILYWVQDYVLIDVCGVGYIVYVSECIVVGLFFVGQVMVFYIELLVCEDLLQLFGFFMFLEKEWYWLLILVQGVGVKVVQVILGMFGLDGLLWVLVFGDWLVLCKVLGVGLKLVQCIVMELKDKVFVVMVLGGVLIVDLGLLFSFDVEVIDVFMI